MQRIEAGEIGEPVIFKSIGRDANAPPISAYQAKLNGMLLYNNTIHDFDLARWLMHDEVIEVHAYTTVAIRPEVAQYGDSCGQPPTNADNVPGQERDHTNSRGSLPRQI